MFLYLVQHGEAKKEGEDPEQRLTEKGKEDVARVAQFAGKLNLNVSEIFHSAKARARETTQIIAEQLRPKKGISLADNLLPMDDPGLWSLRIAGMNEDIMLVGHLPYMAKLTGLLVCGDQGKMLVDFKKGGIVCLKRFEDGRWALKWIIVPEIIL
jgi:phosphohistidine phosphatase